LKKERGEGKRQENRLTQNFADPGQRSVLFVNPVVWKKGKRERALCKIPEGEEKDGDLFIRGKSFDDLLVGGKGRRGKELHAVSGKEGKSFLAACAVGEKGEEGEKRYFSLGRKGEKKNKSAVYTRIKEKGGRNGSYRHLGPRCITIKGGGGGEEDVRMQRAN